MYNKEYLDEIFYQISIYLDCKKAELVKDSDIPEAPPDELEKIFLRIENEDW